MTEFEKPEDAPAMKNRPRGGEQQKKDKRDVHGWVVLDKPIGMTSTHAVAVVKRLFSAKRAGHAGTLDPLATGCLPIALGEATKTVPFIMDSRKRYRFTIRWGEERDTDDAEGRVVETSAARPQPDAVAALFPQFTGTIEQVPPRYSAIKIEGERAYDLARDGQEVVLQSRTDRCGLAQSGREPRSRPFRARDRMRKRHLCPGPGPRYGPSFGLFRPCFGAAEDVRGSFRRSCNDSTGTTSGFMR